MEGQEHRDTTHVFYDGDCTLCHVAVRFTAARDRRAQIFRFAPLAGKTAAARLRPELRGPVPPSLVVCTADGETRTGSEAVLDILRRLGGVWSVLAAAASWVPLPLRERIYRAIAGRRRRFLAASCPTLPWDLAVRFDP